MPVETIDPFAAAGVSSRMTDASLDRFAPLLGIVHDEIKKRHPIDFLAPRRPPPPPNRRRQLTIVGAMMRGMGLYRTLASTPGLLAGGALALAGFVLIDPALLLAAAVGLKVVDGSLRYSLHRTSLETLFVPLTRELRNQVKTFIDVIGQRGGQAVGSLLILLLVFIPGTEIALALLVAGLCLVWIRVAAELRHHYLDLFRSTLREGRFETQIEFPELDLASLETLISTLNSPNDVEVLAALDILAQQRRVRLIPALILYHPSPDVVQRVLELFARKELVINIDGTAGAEAVHEEICRRLKI